MYMRYITVYIVFYNWMSEGSLTINWLPYELISLYTESLCLGKNSETLSRHQRVYELLKPIHTNQYQYNTGDSANVVDISVKIVEKL